MNIFSVYPEWNNNNFFTSLTNWSHMRSDGPYFIMLVMGSILLKISTLMHCLWLIATPCNNYWRVPIVSTYCIFILHIHVFIMLWGVVIEVFWPVSFECHSKAYVCLRPCSCKLHNKRKQMLKLCKICMMCYDQLTFVCFTNLIDKYVYHQSETSEVFECWQTCTKIVTIANQIVRVSSPKLFSMSLRVKLSMSYSYQQLWIIAMGKLLWAAQNHSTYMFYRIKYSSKVTKICSFPLEPSGGSQR